MLTFHLPLFSFLLLSTSATAAAQPYTPTDYFLLNCGGETATTSGQTWDTDDRSKFLPFNTATTTFTSTPSRRDPSVPEIPYSTARIFNTSSFTYTFPATSGPKFLRLYFYPATYNHHNPNQSFFSVSSNGYSLLSNFSAFLTASYLGTILVGGPPVPHFVKEFVIYVNHTKTLNVTFTPAPNSYAFINGIEIVSLPENLYQKSESLKYVCRNSGPVIAEDAALENVYRLNVGGGFISGNDDTGMYRSWDGDEDYLFPSSALGFTPATQTPITYTTDTPNYTAPELVYQTQRSRGNITIDYTMTWRLPVDSGFWYMLRLHFCSIIPQYTYRGQVIFRIFINNQTAEDKADLFSWTRGSGYPVFKDFIVFVNDQNGKRSKQDLWLAMHPNEDQAQNYVSTIAKGTFGYMDPEYYRMQQLTDKSDVYSFGVVLLEVLCARPAVIIGLPFEEVSLTEWAKSHYRKGTLHEIIDPKLSGAIAPKCLMKFGEVASSCLKEKGSKRPSMDEVLWGLEVALQLQEAAEKTGGIVCEFVLEKQELLFPMQGESTTNDGSAGAVIRHGIYSHGVLDSEEVLPR